MHQKSQKSADDPLKTVYLSFALFCRSQSLQRAKMAYKNYHNDYDNLNNWLSHVPNYEPRETDDVRQVETKLRNQRVRVILTYLNLCRHTQYVSTLQYAYMTLEKMSYCLNQTVTEGHVNISLTNIKIIV